jgi:PAS domain S-box-containing protein
MLEEDRNSGPSSTPPRGREKREQGQLHAILEASTDFVCTLTTTGCIRYLNPAARRLLDLPEDTDPRGIRLSDIHPPRIARLIQEVAIPAALQKGVWWGETAIRNRAGEEIPVSQLILVHRAADGEVKFFSSVSRDISGQRATEEALHDFYQQITTILESITDGFFNLDREWRFTYVNLEAARLFQADREELLGRNIWENVPEMKRLRFYPEFEWSLQKNAPVTFTEYYSALGNWYEVHAYPSGNGLSVYFRNVTDRITAYDALQHSETRYRSLFERMSEGFVLLAVERDERTREIELRLLAANPAARRILRVHRADILGRRIQELLPQLDPAWAARFARVVRGGRPVSMRGYIEPLDRFIDLHAFRPAPGQCACIFTDRTVEEKAKRGRQEAEERFRLMAESLSDLCVIYNPDRRIRFINSAGILLTDRPKSELIGRRDEDILPPEIVRLYLPTLEKSIETKQIQRVEIGPEVSGGRFYALIVTFVPLLDDQGRIAQILAITQDITERRRSEQQLLQLTETLEQRVAERTAEVQQQADHLRILASELTQTEQRERRRLSQILHDHLQQLLVAAKIQTEFLAGADEDALGIEKRAKRTLRFLTEAIDVSRSLSVELSPPVLHDAGFCAALDWLSRRLKERYGLRVRMDLQEEAEPESEVLRVMLFEATRELLLNVVKHAGVSEAGVRVSLSEDGEIEVAISDAGSGFDPRLVQSKGVLGGFGLFSIRQRLEVAGGRCEIESAPGQGTRIRLRVPRQAFHAVQKPAAPHPQPARAPSVPTATLGEPGIRLIQVLVADDHKIFREGLVGVLESFPGIKVIGEADNGEQAVALAGELRPDVVIMDISMPRMNGIEATRRLCAEQPQIKVIGLSMHDQEDMAEAMKKAGAVQYLTKDGPSEDLLQAIFSCFDLPTSGPAGARQ